LSLQNGRETPSENCTLNYTNHYVALNRRAPNVVSRNEVGRLSRKLNIYTRILKFWIHLENLSENSIATQSLQIWTQLAEQKKPSFTFYLKEILQMCGCTNREQVQTVHTVINYIMHKFLKITYLKYKRTSIMIALKNHQSDTIWSNRKLQFHSTLRLIKAVLFN